MPLKTSLGLIGFLGCVATAQAQYDSLSGTFFSNGSAPADNDLPADTEVVNLSGMYTTSLTDGSPGGSYNASAGGTVTYNSAAISSEAAAQANMMADTYANSYASLISGKDMLSFDSAVPFTVNFTISGETAVSFGPGSDINELDSVFSLSVFIPTKNGEGVVTNPAGQFVGSIVASSNGFNLTDSDTDSIAVLLNPGDSLYFSYSTSLNTRVTANAEDTLASLAQAYAAGSFQLDGFEIGGEPAEITVTSDSGTDYTPVPEPSTYATLLGLATLAMAYLTRRRG
ncbi:PEP-CTERM sorting domain-containing protein [Cerasicoccus fimbriatus]|uniref:PEP-CTERM sorting domain-containing protein n=1 Tax=Cerasicoccus fimbriatus TaxID=3014554 RepID=UPI0022B32D50|nr:PEP-CTERM sorting domain-containing protein [Cerasicoccus sp. TK19100]